MAQVNQPKKRTMPAEEEEPQVQKLTPREIAFINRTKLPPEENLNSEMEKVFLGMSSMIQKKMVEAMELYGGHYGRGQIMKMYGISKNTLNNWMKTEGLPYYQIGKKILLKKSEIEEFLKKYRKIMPVVVGLSALL